MSIIKSSTGEEVVEANDYEAFYLQLGDEHNMKGLNFGLNDMCEGESRMLRIPPDDGYEIDDMNQKPVVRTEIPPEEWVESLLDVTIKLLNITPVGDFEIFDSLKSGSRKFIVSPSFAYFNAFILIYRLRFSSNVVNKVIISL